MSSTIIFSNKGHRKNDGIYGDRLLCKWNETTPEKKTENIYAAQIDKSNHVYLDCRKRLIFSKILLSTLFRPIHCIAKTLYHLSMIPIAKAVFKYFKGDITKEKAFTRSCRSICDIARTPAYEIAMLVAGVAGIIASPFKPTTLYKSRETIGKIESALFRGRNNSMILCPCFQPVELNKLIEHYSITEDDNNSYLINFDDTDYGDYSTDNLVKNRILHKKVQDGQTVYRIRSHLDAGQTHKLEIAVTNRALIHYGRAMIKTRRKHYNPFYQLFGKLNSEKKYVSPAYGEVVEPAQPPKKQLRVNPEANYIYMKDVSADQAGKRKIGVAFAETRAVNFDDSIRHIPRRKKTDSPQRHAFIKKVKRDLKADLKKLDDKRTGFLIKSVANAFEDAYEKLQKEDATTEAMALASFKKDLHKLLKGNKKSHLKEKALKSDGEALLKTEIKLRKPLKKSALKQAKRLLKKANVQAPVKTAIVP